MNLKDIKKLKICSTYFDIDYVKDLKNSKGEDLRGQILYGEDKIKICIDYTFQRQLQALLHECMHGLHDEFNYDSDEDVIDTISNALYSLMIDNPEYIQKILNFNKTKRK